MDKALLQALRQQRQHLVNPHLGHLGLEASSPKVLRLLVATPFLRFRVVPLQRLEAGLGNQPFHRSNLKLLQVDLEVWDLVNLQGTLLNLIWQIFSSLHIYLIVSPQTLPFLQFLPMLRPFHLLHLSLLRALDHLLSKRLPQTQSLEAEILLEIALNHPHLPTSLQTRLPLPSFDERDACSFANNIHGRI